MGRKFPTTETSRKVSDFRYFLENFPTGQVATWRIPVPNYNEWRKQKLEAGAVLKEINFREYERLMPATKPGVIPIAPFNSSN